MAFTTLKNSDISAPLFHGGNTSALEARYGKPPLGWLDLSTGINPVAYPLPDIPPEDWMRLPEEPLMDGLLKAARQAYGLAEASDIVAAPGTQALIQMLPRLRAPGKVFVLGPTYAEHAHCWRLAGHDVSEGQDLPEPGAWDVIVAVSPNNPDGRVLPRQQILDLARGLVARNGLFVLDGAFMDVSESPETGELSGCEGLVVLRSFGKFYGLAGLRLGFACGADPIVGALRTALGPWAVSGVSARIGATALADGAWAAATRQRLADDSAWLETTLVKEGLTKVGGTTLYHLYTSHLAARLFDHLAQQGILVRRFPGNDQWLRFGLPGNTEDRLRLQGALRSFRR